MTVGPSLRPRGHLLSERHFYCRHTEAVELFTECIRLDPAGEVYFSNRAAARMALKQHAHAVQDALAATKLKPGWAKGWARLAAAYTGLEEHAEVIYASSLHEARF